MVRHSLARRIHARRQRTASGGTLHAKLRDELDQLLEVESSDNPDTYVENPEIEERLRQFSAAQRSSIISLVGSRGAGKTTYLRQLFPSNNPICAKKTGQLFIWFDFNCIDVDRTKIETILFSEILRTIAQCERAFGVKCTDEVLADFIDDTAPNTLYLASGADPSKSKTELVQMLREQLQFDYYAQMLKYFIFSGYFKKVVIIIDNIEAASYIQQRASVAAAIKLRNSLRSRGNSRGKYAYLTNISCLVSCRQATFDRLSRDSEVDGFHQESAIHLEHPASLSEIITKQFADVIKGAGGRKQQFSEAYHACVRVLENLNRDDENFLISLCNNNVRRAKEEMITILRNSRWYEKTRVREGAFEVLEENYRLTTPGFLRALALREYNCFHGAIGGPVANLFANEESPQLDLALPLTAKLFVQRAKSNSITGMSYSEIRDLLEICYPRGYDGIARRVVKFLEQRDMVYVSRDKGEDSGGEIIYSLPRFYAHWRHLANFCILLEFVRDDCFLEHRNGRRYNSGKLCGTSLLRGDELFLAILDCVEEICTWEIRLVASIRRRGVVEEFISNFGPRTIVGHLLKGVGRSLGRFYAEDVVPDRVNRRHAEVVQLARQHQLERQYYK